MARAFFLYENTPAFMEDTFHFQVHGYHYASPPPLDLLVPEVLMSPDPWLVVAGVLERAKRGDFAHVSELKKWTCIEMADPTLIGGCLSLLGDAGNLETLEWIGSSMLEGHGYSYRRMQLIRTAQWTGQLFLIPFLLEVWSTLERLDDRESAALGISNMLDPPGSRDLFVGTCSKEKYQDLVLARAGALCDRYGTDRVAVFRGEAIDIWKMIDSMQKALANPRTGEWIDWGDFLLWRRTFEAYTGADCSSFYDKRGFCPLNAAAVLEEYVEREPRVAFEPGQRYFFGHRVPY